MKEYNKALAELNRVLAEEKKKLATKCQPIFHKQFIEFFEANPEVAQIVFRVESQVYNDETYEDEVSGIQYRLTDDLHPTTYEDEDEHEFGAEYGVLREATQHDQRIAAGDFSRHWQSRMTAEQRQEEQEYALRIVNGKNDLFAKLPDGRRDDLVEALRKLERDIQSIDVEFHQNLFGNNAIVTATKEGFTIV
jgi:hypothetical protein